MIVWLLLFGFAFGVLASASSRSRAGASFRLMNLCDDVEEWSNAYSVPALVHIDYVRSMMRNEELPEARKIEIANQVRDYFNNHEGAAQRGGY